MLGTFGGDNEDIGRTPEPAFLKPGPRESSSNMANSNLRGGGNAEYLHSSPVRSEYSNPSPGGAARSGGGKYRQNEQQQYYHRQQHEGGFGGGASSSSNSGLRPRINQEW